MNIFNRKIRKKHIEQFANKIAELLEPEFPQFKKARALSTIYSINFMEKPKGIHITLGHNERNFEVLKRRQNSAFYLIGISVFNIEEKCYQPIKLFYQSDDLTQIDVENPEYFHKTFDLNKVQKSTIILEHIKLHNPDKKIAEQVLKSLTEEQLQLLEVEDTFEIEFDDKLFYTILTLEDGNYIAVDKSGKVYRMNHDHEERVKLIADKPSDFFKIYSGQKSKLEKVMYEQ